MWLPAKYNFLLFIVPALVYPIAGLLVGEPFTDPTAADLVLLPAVMVLTSNIGYAFKSQHEKSGVVDERDTRNIDLALTVTGMVLLVSITVIYIGYAATSDIVPTEMDYLATAGVVTIFLVLGGTEAYQRL